MSGGEQFVPQLTMCLTLCELTLCELGWKDWHIGN